MIVRVLALCSSAFAMGAVVAFAVSAEGRANTQKAKRVVCFGDSITEGYKITDAFTTPYPTMLQKLLDDKRGKGLFEVVNAGISGQDTRQGLARIDKVIADEKPDLMLILYGTNDLWTGRKMTPADTDRNLRAILARAKASGVKCIIGTIVPVWGFDEKVARTNDVIREIAKDEMIGLADMNDVFEKAIQSAGDRAKESSWEKYYQVEEGGFVHPNDAGNEIIARKWFETLTAATAPK